MKLLITTQAVDERDPVLGFFCRWITEFAAHCEKIEVVCLRKGEYTLPSNVTVHQLGSTRLVRAAQLLWYTTRLTYDAVFVHMNPEYVVVGGLFWKLLHKRVALWYTHKSVDLKLRIATMLTDIVFTASKESFRLPTKKLRVMGHGIDTDFFTPDPSVSRGDWYLSVGRLMPSKDHRMAIVEAANDGKELRIAGAGPELEDLKTYSRSLKAEVKFLGGLSQTALRDEYRKAARLVHTSKTGSLDKVVLEALACGLSIHTHDPALTFLENEGPRYVQTEHSLQNLIPAILTTMQGL